jgi:predicted Holliday junction resolvase-like endonuclease
MKQLLVIFIISLFFIVNCSKEDSQPPRGQFQDRNANMLKQLEEDLFLTQDQVDSIKIAMDQNFKMMQGLREKFGDNREAMRDTIRALREKMNENILKFLNDNQKKDYQKMMEERRARFRERRQQQD